MTLEQTPSMRSASRWPVMMVLTIDDNAENRARCLRMGAGYFFNKSREFERMPEVLKGLCR